MNVVLASRNAHKARELEALLTGWSVQPLPDSVALPPEEADTFVGNALGKARAASVALGGGVPVIADDSGICAEALGGAPGVRSARFAGPDATDAQNLALLVQRAPAGSRVDYVCALVLVDGDREVVVEGRWPGRLVDGPPRGAGGFGYDPIVVPDDDAAGGRTVAELSAAEKDALSHRGRAVRALLEVLDG